MRRPDSSYRVTATPNYTVVVPKPESGGSWWLVPASQFSAVQREQQKRMQGASSKIDSVTLVPGR